MQLAQLLSSAADNVRYGDDDDEDGRSGGGDYHHSAGLTTTTHAIRRALCVLVLATALAAGAAWGLRALSRREEEEEGGGERGGGGGGGGGRRVDGATGRTGAASSASRTSSGTASDPVVIDDDDDGGGGRGGVGGARGAASAEANAPGVYSPALALTLMTAYVPLVIASPILWNVLRGFKSAAAAAAAAVAVGVDGDEDDGRGVSGGGGEGGAVAIDDDDRDDGGTTTFAAPRADSGFATLVVLAMLAHSAMAMAAYRVLRDVLGGGNVLVYPGNRREGGTAGRRGGRGRKLTVSEIADVGGCTPPPPDPCARNVPLGRKSLRFRPMHRIAYHSSSLFLPPPYI